MRKQGKHASGLAPYGYKKSAYDKNKLVIDTEPAEIVRKIYNWYINNNMGINAIAVKLNDSNIPSPSAYKATKGIMPAKNAGAIGDGLWSKDPVSTILKNQVYIGDLVQGTTYSPNHTIKKRVKLPKNKWIIIEDTHEPIISKDIYVKEQEKFRRYIYPTGIRTPHILSGYVKCGDCNMAMYRHARQYKGNKYYDYICSAYKRFNKRACTPHIIKVKELEIAVLMAIQKHIEAMIDGEKLIEQIGVSADFRKEQMKINIHINELVKEKNDIVFYMQSLYEEYVNKVLTQKEYKALKENYQNKLVEIDDKVDILRNKLQKDEDIEKNGKDMIDVLRNIFLLVNCLLNC